MLSRIVRNARRWLLNTSERFLDEAYQAAFKIKQIEDEHFQGKKISSEHTDLGASVLTYFNAELNSNLQIIKMRMAQFKTSRLFANLSANSQGKYKDKNIYNHGSKFGSETDIFLEKLRFIDSITEKYQKNIDKDNHKNNITISSEPQKMIEPGASTPSKNKPPSPKNSKNSSSPTNNQQEPDLETVSDKTGVLPRSFLRTFNRIRQEIDPKSAETEEEVISKFRRSRYKTAISIKFLLLLIIIPLLVHNVTKIVAGQIFIEPYFFRQEKIVFLNQDLQEEAFRELKDFEDNLHFKSMIGLLPELSREELKHEIKRKADELAEDYRRRSAEAVKNIFADISSIIAFACVIFFSKREVLILKSFLDEMIYGLSDPAKAFLIILFTDMFVGFHSPHGWEIILEGISRHFGLPENRDFNFLFIATFPVILDTVLKYWIFRYLNRISPSAVATYKNMNE